LGNLSTPKTVQKLQKALHAKAKAESDTLRRLVAEGKVKMIGRYRRRKVFELGEREAR
jgi:hypothetical protein